MAASDVLASDPLNLVPNGGFDDGLTGWMTTGTAELAPAAGIAAPSLGIEAGTAARIVPAQAGQDYVARALYTLSAGGAANLRVEYLGPGGSVLGQTQVALVQSALWRTAETLFTAPSGTVEMRMTGTVAGAATLHIDDLTLAPR